MVLRRRALLLRSSSASPPAASEDSVFIAAPKTKSSKRPNAQQSGREEDLPGSNSRQSTPNARNALCLWDKFDFGPIFESRGRVRLVRRKAFELHQTIRASKEPVPKPPAIQTLLDKAYDLQKTLATTPGLTRFALAKRMKVDPTRVSQILNLLHLVPRVQTYIRALEPTIHNPVITDRDWNQLARTPESDQLREFENLLAKKSFSQRRDTSITITSPQLDIEQQENRLMTPA